MRRFGLVDILEGKQPEGGQTEAIEVKGHAEQERLVLLHGR